MVEASSVASGGTGRPHRSPFEGHRPGERPNRAGQIGVRLVAGSVRSVTLISTWPDGRDRLHEALGAALGHAVPGTTGDTVQVGDSLLARTGPAEFMLISDTDLDMTATLCKSIGAGVGSVTDLSHARCRIRIDGEKCRDSLSKLFALDLREPGFALDQVRLTGHHHVPCLLHRLGPDCFDIYVFSTYAHDQLSTVIDAALEYGVSLKYLNV